MIIFHCHVSHFKVFDLRHEKKVRKFLNFFHLRDILILNRLVSEEYKEAGMTEQHARKNVFACQPDKQHYHRGYIGVSFKLDLLSS